MFNIKPVYLYFLNWKYANSFILVFAALSSGKVILFSVAHCYLFFVMLARSVCYSSLHFRSFCHFGKRNKKMMMMMTFPHKIVVIHFSAKENGIKFQNLLSIRYVLRIDFRPPLSEFSASNNP